MTRRQIPFLIATAIGAASLQAQAGDSLMSVLKASMETKKGVTLYVRGQTIALVVTALGDQFVEGRSQQASKIVVRIASIDAAALA